MRKAYEDDLAIGLRSRSRGKVSDGMGGPLGLRVELPACFIRAVQRSVGKNGKRPAAFLGSSSGERDMQSRLRAELWDVGY